MWAFRYFAIRQLHCRIRIEELQSRLSKTDCKSCDNTSELQIRKSVVANLEEHRNFHNHKKIAIRQLHCRIRIEGFVIRTLKNGLKILR